MPSTNRHPAAPRLLASIMLTICCALVAFCGSAPAKPTPHKGPKRPPAPLYGGALTGGQLPGTRAPWDMNAVNVFQQAAGGKPLSLIGFSAPFADCTVSPCEPCPFPRVPMESIRNYGAIPIFSWSSSTASTPEDVLPQPAFRLARVIDGTYDAYITDVAENAREWGHPFFLRFNWEMNGFWFPWSESVNHNRPGQYVKAWRHGHDSFTAVGATNATWVWCPNIALVKRLKTFRENYPGHAYVDWTCLDGFNWGEHNNSAGWMTFDHFFEPAYREILKFAARKPMMIGEVASEERGGNKATWIRHLLRVVPSRYRKVKALVWFNEKDGSTRWSITSSRKASRAFARGIKAPVYQPNLYGGPEPASPITPPSWPPSGQPLFQRQ